MSKVLDLNFPILNLDGSNVDPEEKKTAGMYLAEYLVLASTGEPLKMFDWATKMYANQELILDDADLKTLEDFVRNHPGLFNISKSPILRAIGKAAPYQKKGE